MQTLALLILVPAALVGLWYTYLNLKDKENERRSTQTRIKEEEARRTQADEIFTEMPYFQRQGHHSENGVQF